MSNLKISLSAMLLSAVWLNSSAAVETRTIHDGWRFRQGRSEIWYPALRAKILRVLSKIPPFCD